MPSAPRCLILAVFGLMSVACFSSSKTEVKPGATSPQPTQCLALGAYCHSSGDCCTQSCVDNVCAEKK